MSVRYTSGDVSVEIDDAMQDLIRRAIDSDHLIESLQGELDRIQADINTGWPVETGVSLAGWRLFIGVGRDRITARVANVVDYHRFVKGKKHKGRQSWREVVTKPALKRVRDLVRRIEVNWRRRAEGK